jgi:hypothetical protein
MVETASQVPASQFASVSVAFEADVYSILAAADAQIELARNPRPPGQATDTPTPTATPTSTPTPTATPTATAVPTVVKKACPKNATRKHGKCTCKKGYTMKHGKCVKKKKK